MNARAGAAALACTIVLVAPACAGATSVTSPQLQALAAQAAAGNATALAELRAVDTVDGLPADPGAALDTPRPTELEARLRTLATPGPAAAAPDPAVARARAAAVLHGRSYGRAPLPDPLGTVFTKIGHFLRKIAAQAPGGPVVFWIVVALLILAGGGLGARRMMRRLEATRRTAPPDGLAAGEDPRALERRADAAEARGDYSDAIRLRFQAGLLTLGERGRIDYRPSLLTGEARRELDSDTFDELAGRFEEVAYADAPADVAQVAESRDGWRMVLSRADERR